MKIKSNLKNIGQMINIELKNGKPLEVLKEILQEKNYNINKWQTDTGMLNSKGQPIQGSSGSTPDEIIKNITKIKTSRKNTEKQPENYQNKKDETTLPNEPLLIGAIFVGRRFINEQNLPLLSGRRHRIYYALKVGKKIYIKYGWLKIKKLTNDELKEVLLNWSFDYFQKEGACFVEKSGGVLGPQHLLYTKLKGSSIL